MFHVEPHESIPSREEKVLEFWESAGVFKKSLQKREGAPRFTFYDGPPFATGLPHYGHLLAGTIKDVIPRYKTMRGHFVPRRFGWDCHGLPVENEIEKAKELSGAASIEKFGIGAFNEECRLIVLRHTKEWKHTVNRMGRWVDFDGAYHTMDRSFMESVWWVFSQIYGKGLVYEGFKVMPFSTRLGTPLSNFEANLNYKEVDDPSLTVSFSLIEDPQVSLLVWTTTPWTLPSNLALMVKESGEYVYVRQLSSGKTYILAESRVPFYFTQGEYEILKKVRGNTLVGKRYQPLFPYFISHAEKKAFRVIGEECVASDEGTGFVHAAPAFGELDFFACAREGIELICPVDHNGKFTVEVPDFEGRYVKDADKEIIRYLKQEGKVFLHTQIRHRYPFCWRSDTPLIYKAVSTWFVAVEKIKESLLAHNEEIAWVPGHIQKGRFGKWLENARDWAISRNRYWGTPIPLWRSDDGELLVISSIAELEEKTGEKIEDLHRHFIDQLSIFQNGKEFRRVPEVFDCWFESGSMPYAQIHHPFEKKEQLFDCFPADFIAEGLDQTRGWFYTLHVLASALFDKPAFKNVIVNGLILAEDGAKMSKRLKNYPEPGLILNQYGADALRLYLLSSPVMHAEDLKFSEKGVELVLRQGLIPFWNAFVFLSTYAKIYQWVPKKSEFALPEKGIDRWILSCLQRLNLEVIDRIDRYELDRAVEPLLGFIEQLTNWYIRRTRSRFWSEEASQDRKEAFETLYTVLLTMTKIAAPFIPFLSEAIYLELKQSEDPLSVHLCDFPLPKEDWRDERLEKEMALVQEVVGLGHALRKEHKLKVRQPLQKAFVISGDRVTVEALKRQELLIAEELNVKEISFEDQEEGFVLLVAKPNFRVLGKKVGKQMQAVQKVIGELSRTTLQELLAGRTIEVEVEGEKLFLSPEDVSVERKVKEGLIASTSQGVAIALETTLTEELILEGLARELVNKINTMRRESGFNVTDRVVIDLETTEQVKKALELHKAYVMHETLTTQVNLSCQGGTLWDLNGEAATISLCLSV